MSVLAQSPAQYSSVAPSQLARQNMGRVAASSGQLVVILHHDPGLMVELKRWIAKDATDHGQLISDADLTDEAIFDRLDADISFRGIATLLVQKYGYLQPTLNPDSLLAKQQELLIQERVKWLAQDEETERANQRQLLKVQETQECDPRIHSSCQARSGANSANLPVPQTPAQSGRDQFSPELPGLQTPHSYPPSTPMPQRPSPDINVTELLETSDDGLFPFEQVQPVAGTQSERSERGGG